MCYNIPIMGKVVDIFTGETIVKPKSEEDVVNELLDACIETAQHLVACMEDELNYLSQNEKIGWLEGFNMRQEEFGEARDMHVIVNLLHSTFVRYLGLDHTLQQDMDNLYIKLKALDVKNKMETPDDIT